MTDAALALRAAYRRRRTLERLRDRALRKYETGGEATGHNRDE